MVNIGKEAGVGEYLQEIARYPLLSKDQEIMLSRVIQEWQTAEDPTPAQVRKGKRARDKMITVASKKKTADKLAATCWKRCSLLCGRRAVGSWSFTRRQKSGPTHGRGGTHLQM